jgi:excisionase family DNA binding protein
MTFLTSAGLLDAWEQGCALPPAVRSVTLLAVTGVDADAVRDALDRAVLGHLPTTSLLCLETSHNFSGGVALGAHYLGEMAAIARERGVRTHLDGARLFNACAALGDDPHAVMMPFDSVVINLNKGLSAAGGAVLVGGEDFIRETRTNLRRVGGSPGHQAGLLAASGLVALRTMPPQLAEDNRRAAELARRLNVTSGTVQRWVRTGRIRPTLVTPGNQFRFNLDDVLEQLSQPRKRPD